MKDTPIMNDAVMNQKTDRLLFVWLLLTGWFGALMGLPWTLAVLRDYPSTAWWWEAAGDALFYIPASAAIGVWLGKKVGLGSGLRELVCPLVIHLPCGLETFCQPSYLPPRISRNLSFNDMA